MKIFRGTLVHCRRPEKIDILVDHVIGFDEHQQGKVALNHETRIPSTQSRLLSFEIHLAYEPIYADR